MPIMNLSTIAMTASHGCSKCFGCIAIYLSDTEAEAISVIVKQWKTVTQMNRVIWTVQPSAGV
jgi:hypothetical protein